MYGWMLTSLVDEADHYVRRIQHLRSLFIPGTLKICPGELLINFREKSSGNGRFRRLEIPRDGQLA